ncbi:pentatricopeptide repeat-containing protein At1g06140, mitochondrial [Telopea speciosissima]|uniref:pentatricopeptide repeat-containing protein At1g06140, mitochondrial n=1 Tax=Telopea speciosissima TaxID=54955 RepID=UPI001CC82B16|nr:pentatricopeptide repeat-containing protein At1g06140, mitochondrial [Telopea speciosissima]
MFQATLKSFPAISAHNPTKELSSLFNLTKTTSLVKELHGQLIVNGLHRIVFFGTKIADAYIELGYLENASKAFDQISFKNPRSWNTIVAGYSKYCCFSDVLQLYKRLRRESSPVDSFNLVFATKACLGLCLLREGESFHSEAIKWGLDTDAYVAPALLNMYVELGTLEEAQKVFSKISERNSVIWGAMMRGYLKFSKESEVFELFPQMINNGFQLDPFSMEGLIRACGNICAGKDGMALHGYCIKLCFMDSNYCLQTSITDMYTKCGFLDCALKFFKEIPDKDVVLWSTMIAGFAKNGGPLHAISLFRDMLEKAALLNVITFSSVLLACSQLGALQEGKTVHGYVIRNGFELDVVTYTAFIDMYAKCGSIGMAYKVFDWMPERNVYSWSAMINGFGIHGLYSEAITLFSRMVSENYIPNSITFVSVLSACSHSGKVEEGWHYFESMSRDFGIDPTEEHYACIVDLLGRAGKIEEAKLLIDYMSTKPGGSIWGALLSACRIHKRVELAEEVAERLLVLEPDQPSAFILLSNIYAAAGMWEKVKKMRLMMTEERLKKTVGFSSIEVERKVHVFSANDRLACRNTEIK